MIIMQYDKLMEQIDYIDDVLLDMENDIWENEDSNWDHVILMAMPIRICDRLEKYSEWLIKNAWRI